MPTGFESQRVECRDFLERQLESLSAAKEEALATVRQADELLRPLRRALASFADPTEKKPKKPKKRCSTKTEVLGVIHDTLEESGGLPRGELKKRASAALRDRGRNLSMFARLFNDCLSDPSLSVTGGGVALTGTVGAAIESRSSWLDASHTQGGESDDRS